MLNKMTSCTPLSFNRYKNLFAKKTHKSILRELQYEALKTHDFSNEILLDFGGGTNADYLKIISIGTYESVNIDPKINPTWTIEVGAPLPCPANRYDTVLSMNTFEHIFNPLPIFSDLFNVTKPGGRFITAVPFLFPIHAHPDDFFRPTPSWWTTALTNAGYRDIEILPLAWGPFTTGAINSGLPGPCRKLRLHIALIGDLIYSKLRPMDTLQKTYTHHALGYFVNARKPHSA